MSIHKPLLLAFAAAAIPALAVAEVPIEQHFEIAFDNPGFNTHTSTMRARIGGELFLRQSGTRCFSTGAQRFVVTDIQLESANPQPDRDQFPGSIGVVAVYADHSVASLAQVEPMHDSPNTSTTSFASGLVLPPETQLCFEGWDGSPGLADRYAIRSGRVLGYVPVQ